MKKSSICAGKKSQGFSGWSKSYSLKGLVPNVMSENVLHLVPRDQKKQLEKERRAKEFSYTPTAIRRNLKHLQFVR